MSSSTPLDDWTFTNPVNVVRISPKELNEANYTFVHILMGPTGSGKSALIELLSDGTLSISKDTLESVTQEVVCYKLANVEYSYMPRSQYILIDTPGFLDTKLSESRIAAMVTRTLEELRQSVSNLIVAILYLHPITDIRLGASKRDVARLLMAFAKSFKASGIDVATTMWNTIHTHKMADAEARHVALQADIFKSSDDMENFVYKFEFSRESALQVLMGRTTYGWVYDKALVYEHAAEFQSMARDNLINRIGQAAQQLQILSEESIHARTPGSKDHELLETVERSQKMVMTALESFLDDLYELDPATYKSHFSRLPRSFISRSRHLLRQVPFKLSFMKH